MVSKLIDKLLILLTNNLDCKLIILHGKPYLERCYLFKFWGKEWCIHRILMPDVMREYHNHPWEKAGTFILKGGYLEGRMDNKASAPVYRPHDLFTYDSFSGDNFHKILRLYNDEPVWTLFWHTETSQNWGFLDSLTGHYQLAKYSAGKAVTGIAKDLRRVYIS